MKVGDLVSCNCAVNTWYKGTPGIIVEMKPFVTRVLVGGKVIGFGLSQLEVVSEGR